MAGASRGPVQEGCQLGVLLCHQHLETLNYFQQEAQHFHCVPDPASYVVSAGVQIQLLTLRSWIVLQENRLTD